MIQAIHTAVPGRARYKIDELYHSVALKELLEWHLTAHEGIDAASANPLTGNVLVYYNSDKTSTSIASLIHKVLAEYNGGSAADQKDTPTDTANSFRDASGSHRAPTTRDLRRSRNQEAHPWHLREANSVCDSLQTTKASGLSRDTAAERLEQYGPNVLPQADVRSEWEMLLDQFNSLPVALLSAAAGVALFTGGIADAVVILGVVAVNATIGYFTESQSERTIHSLRSLVKPSASVIRDGRPIEISATHVVVGDILVLRPGSYIAADARLIESHRLSVDESTLTGESLPVPKASDPLTVPDLPLADRINMVYMGTLVTGGQGLAVVVATGQFTEIGYIQLLAGEAESPQTPMERQLSQMGSQLVVLSSAVCGLVFVIGLLRGYGFLQMFQSAISLAVAAVPEGLPTVATTTLALGILNMRKHRVLIRNLSAVETLGCVETICLDKTGTLTLNSMSVVAAYTRMRRFQIADGQFSTGGECIDPLAYEEWVKLLQVCVLCSESEIEKQQTQYVLRGSPTENALIHTAISAGVDVLQLREQLPVRKIDLRSENRNFVRTFHRAEPGETNGSPPPLSTAVKGSPSEVLAMCTWQVVDGERMPLTEEDRLRIETENERMAGEALRVLGTAYAERAGDVDRETDESLTWLGLIGMVDPIRKGVRGVIGGFHLAGINTVMITGDQSPTAYAIGKELNLSNNGQLEILDSTHLTNIDPEVMRALARKVHVFARVSPAYKLQIVQALQAAGKVVAMTGDGINDGPALKAANIGIAMGHTGTDVAREVADVVLEDDNLETMILAIGQGRTIYNNIRKSVRFLLATNLSEIIVTFTALAGGLGQPLNTMQLLWINLISDIAPGLALALEPPEPDVLAQPPRNPAEPIIKSADFRRIAFESATLSTGALGAYGYGLLRYGMGAQASSLAFLSLTTGQLLHAVTARSEKHSVFDNTPQPANPYLTMALGGSFAVQILALLVPGLRSLLGIGPVSLVDGMVIGGSALLPFVVNEKTKETSVRDQRGQEHQ